MGEGNTVQLSEEEFVLRAIKRLRKPPYLGIHTVYSGFNQAFKEHFGKNPVEVTKKMAEEGTEKFQHIMGENWPVTQFLEKPLDPEELLSVIDDTLGETSKG